jgi:GTP-binding protein
MFVDQVEVTLFAGNGGNGCSSFRREKGVPKGGPDGGNGGDGGSVFFKSDLGLNSLAYFRFHPIIKAERGAHGKGGNRHGKKGENVYLKVPVGTVVKESGKKNELFDFMNTGQEFLAVKGGKGGRGNASFATSTHQAPREFEEGVRGEEKRFFLELKLIADVGLVGFPNAGKSTLISQISAAKPRIADYPFTTLAPNLGVVDIDEFFSFVVADIPGLIEGAHEGQGLGTHFLKHIERTKILVYLIDVSPLTGREPVQEYQTLRSELEKFNPSLPKRPHFIVANKIDLLSIESKRTKDLKMLARKMNIPYHPISALRKIGLKEMIHGLYKEVRTQQEEGRIHGE